MQKGFMPILEKKASIVKPKLIKDSSYAKYNVNIHLNTVFSVRMSLRFLKQFWIQKLQGVDRR